MREPERKRGEQTLFSLLPFLATVMCSDKSMYVCMYVGTYLHDGRYQVLVVIYVPRQDTFVSPLALLQDAGVRSSVPASCTAALRLLPCMRVCSVVVMLVC